MFDRDPPKSFKFVRFRDPEGRLLLLLVFAYNRALLRRVQKTPHLHYSQFASGVPHQRLHFFKAKMNYLVDVTLALFIVRSSHPQ
jgi:hypothetical protein